MESGGAQLLEWRRRRGHTQSEVAKILGCDPSMVSHLETGARSPRLPLSVKIQRLTGISHEAWVSSAMDNSGSGVGARPAKARRTKGKAA